MVGRRPASPKKSTGKRDRPNARGEATRLEILLKAEELFAERGISVVPLRDIGLAAGQKNNVAVQYHFGDRQTLVQEIAKFRAETSERTRAELLAGFLSKDESPTVPDLVDIVIESLACHLDADNHYLAFLSRYVVAHGGYQGLEELGSPSSIHTILSMLRRLLPDIPAEVVEERFILMMTSAIHTLARYQAADRTGRLSTPLDDLLSELVAFFAAGIGAEPPG